MSPRKPECSETARIATGCSVWSSSARSPPTNIDASPCTRVIGLPASNQRGPSRKWIRSRCLGPSGPATCRNSAWPSRLRRSGSTDAMWPSLRDALLAPLVLEVGTDVLQEGDQLVDQRRQPGVAVVHRPQPAVQARSLQLAVHRAGG